MKAGAFGSLSGIILAGGASRRMGRDKATLPWGDSTVLEHLCRQLQPLSLLVVVGPDEQRLPPVPGGTLVYDDQPYAGPLAGLAKGLAYFPTEAVVLVTGCDYPLLTMELVMQLLQAMNDAEAVVLVKDGVRQPFPGIYRAAMLPKVEQLLEVGRRSMQALLDAVECKTIAESMWQAWPGVERQLTNINTPEEYQRALRL
jgi:molybdenum cofactor guanylyltransferase